MRLTRYNVLTRVVSLIEATSPEEARVKAAAEIDTLLGTHARWVYPHADQPSDVIRAEDQGGL